MNTLKNEPAVLLGLLASICVAVQEQIASNPDWKLAVPIVLGIITRFFVSPAPAK